MVIARFHRTLAIVFFLLLIVVVVAILGFLAFAIWNDGLWVLLDSSPRGNAGWETLLVLVSVPGLLLMIAVVFRDSRAIWIEDGVLHIYTSAFDETFFFLVSKEAVPLDAIAGLSSVKEKFPGAVQRPGIYVDLKSGKSYKIMTFLLTERRQTVMTRLREALGFPEVKA